MNDQLRMRRNLGLFILAIPLVILLVAGGVMWHRHQVKSSPLYTTKIVDKATGEVLYNQPNQVPEQSSSKYITIFGSQVLFQSGATQAQFQLIQRSLTTYAQKNLANKYQTLTILPSGFKADHGDLAGQLQLGQTSQTVNLDIKLSQLKYVQLNITDPSGQNGGNYESGQMTVPAQTYQGTD